MNVLDPSAVYRRLPRLLLLLSVVVAVALAGPSGNRPQGIVLLSPVPGAQYVPPGTTLLIRFEHPIDGIPDPGSALTVTGSTSGKHDGTFVISGHDALIFKPALPFAWNERVTVDLQMARLQPGKTAAQTTSYSFMTSRRQARRITSFESEVSDVQSPAAASHSVVSPNAVFAAQDSLPSTFPVMSIVDSGDTSTGFLFLSNFTLPALTVTPYLMILHNNGSPVFYRQMQGGCFDFKVQPNGRLSYFDGSRTAFYELDSSYAIVDSFRVGNGYTTDGHDFRILPDGHALMMATDPEIVDMSAIVDGGDTTATVIGLIIQEVDDQQNVVFQWRSWDHYQITDATHERLTAPTVDYVHGNALEIDDDGNFIVSCRHMDEITKIDRQTGDILWRWGGENNQFTFLNDTLGFSHQHSIRRIANGNFTMFDNGNFQTPNISRALEYQVDEQNKVATLVWQYVNSVTTYGPAMGYVQRLSNGNTLIGWGTTNPTVTEVRPDGTKIYELNLPPKEFSYRAYRFPWRDNVIAGLTPPQSHELPTQASLDQNYPNPFNPTTTIKYDIGGVVALSGDFPEHSRGVEGRAYTNVRLVVYDILGREVALLVNERKAPGSYDVRFDASALSSGVYLYRFTAGNFVHTRRMLLLH